MNIIEAFKLCGPNSMIAIPNTLYRYTPNKTAPYGKGYTNFQKYVSTLDASILLSTEWAAMLINQPTRVYTQTYIVKDGMVDNDLVIRFMKHKELEVTVKWEE